MDNLPLSSSRRILDASALRQLQPQVPAGPGHRVLPEEPASFNPFLALGHFLRRWRWTLLLTTLVGMLGAIAVTLLQPTLYEARATLEIQDLNDTFLNLKQFMPVNESDGPSNTYGDIQTQIKFLQSDGIVKSAAEKMPGLEKAATNTLKPRNSWLRSLVIHAPAPNEYVDQETKRLVKTLKVRAIGQTRIIELTAESSSPQMAADFLNALCTEYIEKNIKARYEMGQHTSASLARLLDTERDKLRKSEDALQNYAKDYGLVFTSANKSVAEERLSQLQDELSKAEENRIGAQSRYEIAQQSSSPEVLPQDIAPGAVQDYRSKLTQLRQQLAEMRATYTDEYYRVKRLEAQIAELETVVSQEGRTAVEQANNQYREALRREKLLNSSYATQSALITDLAKRAIQYNMLEREVEGNRQSYDEMLKQVNEATVAAAIRTDNVRVVDEAAPPKNRQSPKPLLNCALGLLVGCSVGFLLAFVRQQADSSLREPGEVVQHLGLTELGAVVHVNRSELSLRRLLTPGGLWSDVSYPVVESFRAIVTSLISEGGANYRVLVVTSPGCGEGKTTVTANLALMLTAIGRRVLLVDGDLRKPRLHKIFNLHNDKGLSTLLEGDVKDSQHITKFVQETTKPGLSVLTSGPPSSNSANLLYSNQFHEIIRRLKREYQAVLIDTPPVLPLADARVIGALADAAIVVLRARQTTRDAAEIACQRLTADGVPIMGVILNDWDPTSSPYRYYSEYARAYALDGRNKPLTSE